MFRLALLILLLFGMQFPAAAQDGKDTYLRKVGVLAHRGDEAAIERWQPTFDAVTDVTRGWRFEVVPLSLDGVRAAVANGDIDYLFTNPGHLYRLVERFRLSPMAALRTDRDGAPETGNRFGAVIFVRSENADLQTLADLKGRRLAAVAPDAFGGFEIAAATLIRNGVNPWKDLDSISFLGFPQFNVIGAVMDGTVDAGTVRTGMLENAVMAGDIEPHEVRVLNATRVPGFNLALSTELVPEWILSATSNVPEPERRSVAIELLRLQASNPAVAGANYGGWTTVPSDAAVRRLLETVDQAKPEGEQAGSMAFWVAGLAALLALAALAIAYRRRRALLPAEADAVMTDTTRYVAGVHLTPREREVLALVGDGKTTKEIARDLGISPKTVEFHRGHLMRKYDAHNMAELIRKAGDTLAA